MPMKCSIFNKNSEGENDPLFLMATKFARLIFGQTNIFPPNFLLVSDLSSEILKRPNNPIKR